MKVGGDGGNCLGCLDSCALPSAEEDKSRVYSSFKSFTKDFGIKGKQRCSWEEKFMPYKLKQVFACKMVVVLHSVCN